MKPIPKAPGLRAMCPEKCRYRDRLAPFCEYCMLEILDKEKEVKLNADDGRATITGVYTEANETNNY